MYWFRFLDMLENYSITFTGGFAIFVTITIIYLLMVGIYQILVYGLTSLQYLFRKVRGRHGRHS